MTPPPVISNAPPPPPTGVWVPTNLFTMLAACYYGDGPRYGNRHDPVPPPLDTGTVTSPLDNPGSLTPTPAIRVSGFSPRGVNARPSTPVQTPDMMGGVKAPVAATPKVPPTE